MSRGFDTYWLAGGEIWAAKAGAPCEIDLELAVGLHALHIREALACAHAGDRPTAADHRDRAGELARIIREQSDGRRACSALGGTGCGGAQPKAATDADRFARRPKPRR
jgi:hypothetical protein